MFIASLALHGRSKNKRCGGVRIKCAKITIGFHPLQQLVAREKTSIGSWAARDLLSVEHSQKPYRRVLLKSISR